MKALFSTDYADKMKSKCGFILKPPLSDGGGEAGSASSRYGDSFFENEVNLFKYSDTLTIGFNDTYVFRQSPNMSLK